MKISIKFLQFFQDIHPLNSLKKNFQKLSKKLTSKQKKKVDKQLQKKAEDFKKNLGKAITEEKRKSFSKTAKNLGKIKQYQFIDVLIHKKKAKNKALFLQKEIHQQIKKEIDTGDLSDSEKKVAIKELVISLEKEVNGEFQKLEGADKKEFAEVIHSLKAEGFSLKGDQIKIHPEKFEKAFSEKIEELAQREKVTFLVGLNLFFQNFVNALKGGAKAFGAFFVSLEVRFLVNRHLKKEQSLDLNGIQKAYFNYLEDPKAQAATRNQIFKKMKVAHLLFGKNLQPFSDTIEARVEKQFEFLIQKKIANQNLGLVLGKKTLIQASGLLKAFNKEKKKEKRLELMAEFIEKVFQIPTENLDAEALFSFPVTKENTYFLGQVYKKILGEAYLKIEQKEGKFSTEDLKSVEHYLRLRTALPKKFESKIEIKEVEVGKNEQELIRQFTESYLNLPKGDRKDSKDFQVFYSKLLPKIDSYIEHFFISQKIQASGSLSSFFFNGVEDPLLDQINELTQAEQKKCKKILKKSNMKEVIYNRFLQVYAKNFQLSSAQLDIEQGNGIFSHIELGYYYNKLNCQYLDSSRIYYDDISKKNINSFLGKKRETLEGLQKKFLISGTKKEKEKTFKKIEKIQLEIKDFEAFERGDYQDISTQFLRVPERKEASLVTLSPYELEELLNEKLQEQLKDLEKNIKDLKQKYTEVEQEIKEYSNFLQNKKEDILLPKKELSFFEIWDKDLIPLLRKNEEKLIAEALNPEDKVLPLKNLKKLDLLEKNWESREKIAKKLKGTVMLPSQVIDKGDMTPAIRSWVTSEIFSKTRQLSRTKIKIAKCEMDLVGIKQQLAVVEEYQKNVVIEFDEFNIKSKKHLKELLSFPDLIECLLIGSFNRKKIKERKVEKLEDKILKMESKKDIKKAREKIESLKNKIKNFDTQIEILNRLKKEPGSVSWIKEYPDFPGIAFDMEIISHSPADIYKIKKFNKMKKIPDKMKPYFQVFDNYFKNYHELKFDEATIKTSDSFIRGKKNILNLFKRSLKKSELFPLDTFLRKEYALEGGEHAIELWICLADSLKNLILDSSASQERKLKAASKFHELEEKIASKQLSMDVKFKKKLRKEVFSIGLKIEDQLAELLPAQRQSIKEEAASLKFGKITFSPYEVRGLTLLDQVIFHQGEKVLLTKDEEQQFKLFLDYLKGNDVFNKKIMSLKKIKNVALIQTYFGEATFEMAAKISFFSKNIKDFESLSKRFEGNVQKLVAGEKIPKSQRLNTYELGVLNYQDKLGKIYQEFVNEGALEALPHLQEKEKKGLPLSWFEESYLRAEKLKPSMKQFSELCVKDAPYKSGDILLDNFYKKFAYVHKDPEDTDLAHLVLITKYAHAGVVLNQGDLDEGDPKLTLSHVLGDYYPEDLNLKHLIHTEYYRLDPCQFVTPQFKVLLSKKNKKWQEDLRRKFEIISAKANTQNMENLSVKNFDVKREWAGRAKFDKKIRYGGHKGQFAEAYDMFFGKGLKEGEDRKIEVICSEFTIKAVVASLLELERELYADLPEKEKKRLDPLKSPKLKKRVESLQAKKQKLEAELEELAKLLEGVEKNENQDIKTKNKEIEDLKERKRKITNKIKVKNNLIFTLTRPKLIEIPVEEKENFASVHPGRVKELLKKGISPIPPSKTFAQMVKT